MTEYCLDCYNRVFKKSYKKQHVIIDCDICAGCGEMKECVIKIRYERIFELAPTAEPKRNNYVYPPTLFKNATRLSGSRMLRLD